MKKGVLRLLIVLASFSVSHLPLLVLTGCQSYTIEQQNVFSDDDGRFVTIAYGRSERDHVNTFVSPMTGKVMEFRSKLMVKAYFPNGDAIKAWQCMNSLPRGTMYETDDGEWKVLANGFSVIIFQRTGEPPPRDYLEVYRGVMCETTEMPVEKKDKWRDITHQGGREYKRPAPIKR